MKRKGFTLIELLVVIAIIALLIGLLLPALAKAQKNARSLRDKTQVKQIHQSMLIFAEDNKGRLPVPGLINRELDPYTNQHMPDRGPEDETQNHSAPMYSLLIAQNFFNPDICFGPTETNPTIIEMENYDHGKYRPDNDIYWDDNFSADIRDGSNTGSARSDGAATVSYFHMAICGKRKDIKWRNTQDAGDPMVSTRGTCHGTTGNDGVAPQKAYAKSQTLELHGPDREWNGNVVFGDNSAETIKNFYPTQTNYQPNEDGANSAKDNIFNSEFMDYDATDGEAGNDAYLILSVDADPDGMGVEEVYDNLLNGDDGCG